ncbi:MAG TPA: TIGR02597 family protein [Chthoniobacterales bacterium]
MKNYAFPLIACVLLGAPLVRAESVYTDPVGVVNITIKGNSDTIVAVPLTPNPDYSGKVTSAASGGANAFNLNVTGTTGWTANQFANLYYVRMTSGAKNGMYYTITANTTGQVTVDTAGDNLSTIAANDTFKIFKYWTLATLFPPASAGTPANPLTASASTSPLARQTQILITDPNVAGINNAATASYYFISASNWYVSGSNQISNNVILYPDNSLVIRQPASVASDVVWSSAGSVMLSSLAMPLLTQAVGPQDNAIALMRPVDVKLSDLGLDSAFTQSSSTSPLARRDQLFVFDNTTSGINKSASRAYYRTGGTWRKAGADSVVADGDVIRAGDAFMIRKFQTGTGASVVWNNTATY